MRLPSCAVTKIRKSFALHAAGELDKHSSLYEAVHVAHCYYDGNADLAQAMLLRDIELNFEKVGVYRSNFSYRNYQCCERAREKAAIGMVVHRLIASFKRSDYVTLSFSEA